MRSLSSVAAQYGPEMALVLACLRMHVGTATTADAQALVAGHTLQWPLVRQLSGKHRVRPLVFRTLAGLDGVPPDVQKRFRADLLNLMREGVESAREVERVLGRLRGAGIPALPYKGMAFAAQVYGELGLRERGDIDVIIPEQDLERAMVVMREDGFSDPQHAMYRYMGAKAWRQKTKDYCFDKAEGGVRKWHVELHYRIIGSGYHFPFAHNQFRRDGLVAHTLLSGPIEMLPVEEHVRALLMHHLMQDRMGYLRTVLDATLGLRACAHPEAVLPAPGFLNHGPLLALIEDLLGVEILPGGAMAQDADHLAEEILSSGYRKVRGSSLPIWNAVQHHGHALRMKGVFYRYRRDHVRAVLKTFGRLVSPQTIDFAFLPLPRWLYPAYFLVRPYRLLFHPDRPDVRKRALRQG